MMGAALSTFVFGSRNLNAAGMKYYVARKRLLACVLTGSSLANIHSQTTSPTVLSVREADSVCAQCHDKEYRTYLEIPMARASGVAADNSIPGRYYLKSSGTSYTIAASGGSVSLTYQNADDPQLDGKDDLLYFLGSGHLGVTYMYMIHGYLLESPIAYYSKLVGYDLKPGLSADSGMPAALPMCQGRSKREPLGRRKREPVGRKVRLGFSPPKRVRAGRVQRSEGGLRLRRLCLRR